MNGYLHGSMGWVELKLGGRTTSEHISCMIAVVVGVLGLVMKMLCMSCNGLSQRVIC